jgi:homoserine kinase
MSVRVRVPASSANLGPGFDALGLALDIYNYVCVDEAGVSGAAHDTLRVVGEGAGTLVCDADNIAFVAARRMLEWAGHPNVPLHLTLENNIPLSRGLGSSAAARVGALVAVNEWLRRRHWRTATRSELVSLASELEGHPDNVAAALLGGLVASCEVEEGGKKSAMALHLHIERFPRLMVFIPDSELATSAARGVLPDAIFRADATFNITRTALLLASLTTGRWDVLPEALRDCLHQPHRAQLMPGFLPMLHAAREAGAYGATLSGAGPTVLAWMPDGDEELAGEVRQALETAAAQHEVFGQTRDVQVDLHGCVVEG